MSKKNHSKQPTAQYNPTSAKVPKLDSSIGSISDLYPSWHFDKLDLEFRNKWEVIDRDCLINEILPKLKEYEKMQWKEIGGRSSHFVSVSSIISEAQRRLEQLKLEDTEHLFSFRLSGTKRIYGIQYNSIIKLLWWDPHHLICPSPKKYT